MCAEGFPSLQTQPPVLHRLCGELDCASSMQQIHIEWKNKHEGSVETAEKEHRLQSLRDLGSNPVEPLVLWVCKSQCLQTSPKNKNSDT